MQEEKKNCIKLGKRYNKIHPTTICECMNKYIYIYMYVYLYVYREYIQIFIYIYISLDVLVVAL